MAQLRQTDIDPVKVTNPDELTVAPVDPLDQTEIDHDYFKQKKSVRFYRSVLFQMFMFGSLAFAGPSMADAISNLGGGGLKNPDLANLAQCLNYAGTCLMVLFCGPLINKIGIKNACLINSTVFWMSGTGFFINIKYGVEWWLIVAKIITGFGNALLYVGESTAMLTYPLAAERGKYLSIWAGMRNSGSVIGGAISFGVNAHNTQAGSVALATYIVFIAFESTGPIWALLLSPTAKVRRSNGSRVPMSPNMSWKQEFKALAMHARNKRMWLMALPSYYSLFHWSISSTYLAIHFSVRSRALSSFIAPLTAVLATLLYGKFLDIKRFTQKQRAWYGLVVWAVPQAIGLVWLCIMWNVKYPTNVALDYGANPGAWAAAYFPFLIVFTTSFWVQIYLYWILSTFSTDVKAASRTGGLFRAWETAGQTTAYAVCAKSYRGRYMTYVNIALMLASLVVLPFLLKLIPERPLAVDDVVGDRVEVERVDRKVNDIEE